LAAVDELEDVEHRGFESYITLIKLEPSKQILFEANNHLALFLFELLNDALLACYIVAFQSVHVKKLIRVKGKFWHENEVREEIHVYAVCNESVGLNDISIFVCIWTESVEFPIGEHDVAPLGLEHAHYIFGLDFVAQNRPV